jgi:GcrA cell cycle regulator
MLWTDDSIEQLKTMWTAGMSGGQIAATLGGLTRNAVIGKVHRLKLPTRESPLGAQRKRNPKRAYPHIPKALRPTIRNDTAQSATETKPTPRKQRRTLLQLTSQTCRWPIGDPGTKDFYFCGGFPKGGGPYCVAHCVLAYQPRRAS